MKLTLIFKKLESLSAGPITPHTAGSLDLLESHWTQHKANPEIPADFKQLMDDRFEMIRGRLDRADH